jgi:membrane protein implicated in regulation of membrane protease activity
MAGSVSHGIAMPPLPLFWLILSGVLLLLEAVGIDGDGLLFVGAVAALLLTLVAALLPLPGVPQVLLWAALVAAGSMALRRWLARGPERRIPPAAGAEQAEVIAAFNSEGQGRVRWQGQSWAAVNLEPERPLEPGSQVTVMGREGTRLQVLPISRRT